MKKLLILILVMGSLSARAQVIDSIFVHLYTDSLKKGTYNYINIDGKLKNGQYLPLDTSQLVFTASDGKFYGNSLWIDPDFKKEKVTIQVQLKQNRVKQKIFDVYIKKQPDPELKTLDEILNEGHSKTKKRRG